jgi:hypothetical protein
MDHTGASAVVCQFEQASLDPAQLAVWSCVDNLVHSHGNRSLAGLEEDRIDSRSNASLPAAIAAQCRVVRGIFSAAISRSSLCRNCHFVVRDPGDIDRILESSSGRRLVALAIFDLGQLRDSAQLFNLADERLTMLATTLGMPH